MNVTVTCQDTNHASRSGQLGWSSTVGDMQFPAGTTNAVITQLTASVRCDACARALSQADAVAAANRAAVTAAIAQTIIDMQAILDTAAIPAGTLTSAQLSNFVRTAQTQINSVALRVKQMARLLNGDFTSST